MCGDAIRIGDSANKCILSEQSDAQHVTNVQSGHILLVLGMIASTHHKWPSCC